jgi:hypothetical protein
MISAQPKSIYLVNELEEIIADSPQVASHSWITAPLNEVLPDLQVTCILIQLNSLCVPGIEAH